MASSNKELPARGVQTIVIAVVLAGSLLAADVSFAGGEGHNQYLSRRDTIALGAGDAKDTNRAIHTIDPWPPYSRNDRLTFDGPRMRLGITRYQQNKSIEPQGMATQDVSKGNGPGIGGAGAGR